MKVMIVDDSSTARMFIRRCIEISACEETDFIEFPNGQDALEKIEESKPDIIFSDYTMPEMNGLELVEKIRATEKYRDILIYIISSAGNSALEEKLLEAGANAVLKKPISPACLMPLMNP
jgi:two-component system chemotaxis response regulator CheY